MLPTSLLIPNFFSAVDRNVGPFGRALLTQNVNIMVWKATYSPLLPLPDPCTSSQPWSHLSTMTCISTTFLAMSWRVGRMSEPWSNLASGSWAVGTWDPQGVGLVLACVTHHLHHPHLWVQSNILTLDYRYWTTHWFLATVKGRGDRWETRAEFMHYQPFSL